MSHKIEFPEVGIIRELINLVRKIYQHEQCPNALKSYIKFECKKFFKPELEISEYLDKKD